MPASFNKEHFGGLKQFVGRVVFVNKIVFDICGNEGDLFVCRMDTGLDNFFQRQCSPQNCDIQDQTWKWTPTASNDQRT